METTMKSFKEYLTESKKIYEFKIKIAGDIPSGYDKIIKSALSQFNVESVSKPKRTPIQESPIDFPNVKFSEVSVFDVVLSYPTTSQVVASALNNALKIDETRVLVRTLGEDAEARLNANSMLAPDGKGALLGTDYESSNNQELVGEKQKLSFLKSLAGNKHELEEVSIDSPLNVKAKPATKGQDK
jgi:hypothetical protein